MRAIALLASLTSVASWLATPAARALELAGDITACHDPSRIIEADGRYYVFSTAPNVNVRSSSDLVEWRWEPQIFDYASGIPPWMAAIGSGDNLWAPDLIEAPDGQFLAFYSRNLNPASGERSVCGVASSPSITGPFSDGQALLDTTLLSDFYRVIDPAPIYDETGRLWVAVGSFGAPNGSGYDNGGIRLFELDPQTGKLETPGDDGTRLAGSWIEAAFLHRHGGYYYLFFNQSVCCAGLDSTYFIRVGRSASLTGPYSDLEGRSLLTPTSGGSLFMGLEFSANYSGSDTDATPLPNSGDVGRELGPGHAAISLLSDGIERLSYHFYDTATANGEPTLGIKSVIWGEDGWPRPGWDPSDGVYAIGTRSSAEPGTPGTWLEAGGAPELSPYTGADTQLWELRRVAPNRYTLASQADGRVVGVSNGAVALLDASSASAETEWFLEQTNDGGFRVSDGAVSRCLQLPEGAASPASAPEVGPCVASALRQRWFITPAGTYRLRSASSGLYAAASNAAGEAVVQRNGADAQTQQFWLVPTADGYTRLLAVGSSLALTVEDGSTAVPARVVLEADTGAVHQQWSLDGLTDGSRRLVPRSSGQALGVANASREAGAALEQQRWSHVRNQQWELELVAGVNPLPPAQGGAAAGGSSAGGAAAGGAAGQGSPSGGPGGSPQGGAGESAGTGGRAGTGGVPPMSSGGFPSGGVVAVTAGSPGAGRPGGGASSAGSAALPTPNANSDDSGCACGLAHPAGSRNLWFLLAAAGAAVFRRRRR